MFCADGKQVLALAVGHVGRPVRDAPIRSFGCEVGLPSAERGHGRSDVTSGRVTALTALGYHSCSAPLWCVHGDRGGAIHEG